jgi:hypothetical protein
LKCVTDRGIKQTFLLYFNFEQLRDLLEQRISEVQSQYDQLLAQLTLNGKQVRSKLEKKTWPIFNCKFHVLCRAYYSVSKSTRNICSPHVSETSSSSASDMRDTVVTMGTSEFGLYAKPFTDEDENALT